MTQTNLLPQTAQTGRIFDDLFLIPANLQNTIFRNTSSTSKQKAIQRVLAQCKKWYPKIYYTIQILR